MLLSEEQVKRLIEWFINSSETKRNLSEDRRKASEGNHKWIQPDIIRKLSDDDLEEKFLGYYNSGGGRQSLNRIYRDRIIREKRRFRDMILSLFNEDIDIQERIDQVLRGNYRVEGFGKAILTSFLMDYNPNKYCLWNNKTEMGFSVIGWNVYESADSLGVAYSKVLMALQKLRGLKPEFNLSFGDIDLFLHTISAENEGRDVVDAIIEGREFLKPIIEEAREERQNTMEFAMEKYLEEFIETNFSRINFGANIELYQGEENTGRQYPTPIGNIDLLAVDKEKKEFVVIELKKGRSSDVVVGQILRYMGWVKE